MSNRQRAMYKVFGVKSLATVKLLFSDENYAELVPSQQIELIFTLHTNGHYKTITLENP